MRGALASSNPSKARELAALLPGWTLEPLDMTGAPDETGSSFGENALAKARHGRAAAPADAWVLGEDSGIEVDALGGEPGVRSARFAREGASDEENVARLLEALAGVPDVERGARYVCELVCVTPAGVELRGSGALVGRVAQAPRGSGGFGYDPVMLPAGEPLTVAELGDGWKALQSHRARAVQELLGALARHVAQRGERHLEALAGCGTVPAMEAGAALAELFDVSTQMEAAILLDQSGAVLASSLDDDARSQSLARLVRDVLAAAQSAPGSGREPLVQLQAALPDGSVFVAQDERRIAACVTAATPTPGLVFYDLKNCLRQLAGEREVPAPRASDGATRATPVPEGKERDEQG